jgi:periodic tryptophan protein 1
LVLCYDARMLSSSESVVSTASTGGKKSKKAPLSGTQAQPKYTISAHDGPASALDVNPHVPGCLATGGMDKIVKIWNVNEDEGKREISLVTSRDLGVVSLRRDVEIQRRS